MTVAMTHPSRLNFAMVYSRAQVGVQSPLVSVEVHLSQGLPGLSMVGLPEAAVKESKDRVRGAIIQSNLEFPRRRITINLAPADLPKEGGRFDLAIAIGILAASGQISNSDLHEYEFIGELALSGDIRKVRGILPACMQCRQNRRTLLLPTHNIAEAALVKNVCLLPARHLLDVTGHLNHISLISAYTAAEPAGEAAMTMDLSDIRGQPHAKRALEVAAAGGHNLLMVGPPGTGKTMLASRMPGILPAMSEQEALQSAAMQSISETGFDPVLWRQRPFRAPHHTASGVALVGGGSNPKPGEISLAHQGVLFLDELPEFDRKVLEVLREPLESGRIIISRAARQAEFPAQFQLVAAMNPCPCGYLGDPDGRCRCTEEQTRRYRHKISGPLLDRFDIHIEVSPVPKEHLRLSTKDGIETGEKSKQVRLRVESARQWQLERCGKANSRMNQQELTRHCQLDNAGYELLERAMEKLKLSARAYHRIIKVSRTVADLADESSIQTSHLAEAISYRRLDRAGQQQG